MSGPPLALPTLEQLRERRSARWRLYPPDVLPAFVAEMDLPLAPPVAAALHRAIDRGDTGYAQPDELPEAFAEFAVERWGWTPDAAGTLVVGDVLAGVTAVLRWLTAPGDAVVVMPPVYPPFFPTVTDLADRPLVEVPLEAEGGRLVPDLAGLEAAFAAGARTLLMCHPHNPTGVVLDRDELAAVAAVCTAHDVLVISDEVHAPLTMPGVAHVPWPMVGDPERCVVVTSASKAWNLPGLKCALVVPGGPGMARELARRLPGLARRAGPRPG